MIDKGDCILSCECVEGNPRQPQYTKIVQRKVYEMPLTRNNIEEFWKHASQYPVLFQDYVGGDFKKFLEILMSQDGETISANGLFWIIDDFVGVFYMSHINIYDAQIHYSFFDRRHSGRSKLTRMMIKYVFDKFHFHRLSAEIPKFSVGARGFIDAIGMKKEGVRRESILYKDQWYDSELFGILNSEVHDPNSSFNKPEENKKWA